MNNMYLCKIVLKKDTWISDDDTFIYFSNNDAKDLTDDVFHFLDNHIKGFTFIKKDYYNDYNENIFHEMDSLSCIECVNDKIYINRNKDNVFNFIKNFIKKIKLTSVFKSEQHSKVLLEFGDLSSKKNITLLINNTHKKCNIKNIENKK